MKFSINRSKFVEQLNNVQFAISSRSTIPVLSGIKLVAQNNQLILTGSDADISIEASIEVDEESQLEIEKTGSIVVMPARMLMEIVKKLPDETVVIELKESTQVSIDSKTSSFVINGIEADQYPHLPEIDADKRIRLPAQLFKQIIRQTVIAVSKHESRPILTVDSCCNRQPPLIQTNHYFRRKLFQFLKLCHSGKKLNGIKPDHIR